MASPKQSGIWQFWLRLQDSLPAVVAISMTALLLPAVHPTLIPLVGAPSHLLWWIHVLPVAMATYRFGIQGMLLVVVASAALVLIGERLFGSGYGRPADWETALSLFVALSATNLLVAGFALYARFATARLREFAYRDPLTQLPNRRYLENHLHQQCLAGHPQTLLFLDLSDFNSVNDSFGHLVGDRLLQMVGERLAENLDRQDLLTYWAGDKFFILLQSCEADSEAEQRAQQLLDVLHEPIAIEGLSLPLDACIGIARGEKQASQLMREADTALNRAKNQEPGSIVFFGPTMWNQAQRRLTMTSAMKTAIKEQGFINYYQPVHDSRSGQIVGVEALVRWDHEEFGRVSPGEFIPLAEANGSIVSIGAQVLEAALADVARWRREGLWHDDLFLSVNLSPLQLVDTGFADTLEASLERWQVAASSLVLEITETTFMQFDPAAIATLRRLREWGLRLAIDDFGSGYSSLTRLHQLPADYLKLDRELILQIDQDVTDLVRPVTEIAAMLDLQVIAEGIETHTQLERLVGMGVPMIQGFLLSRPQTPDRVWMRAPG
ncbi:MAG: EAL domain-containing protein [Halofilum sp. (in: g-proteobacteria)]|nr:EAL domain-containing protein [Halofilum sp. (in: g-proteobacteria)]